VKRWCFTQSGSAWLCSLTQYERGRRQRRLARDGARGAGDWGMHADACVRQGGEYGLMQAGCNKEEGMR
jgi:hypothetical protein